MTKKEACLLSVYEEGLSVNLNSLGYIFQYKSDYDFFIHTSVSHGQVTCTRQKNASVTTNADCSETKLI